MATSRPLRLAALGLWHEANTFSNHVVDPETIEIAGVLRGPKIVERHAGGTTTMSGFLAARECPGVEVVPLVMTTLLPGGPIMERALTTIAEQMVDSLAKNGPFDGVLAALHGAAVAEHTTDVDGYLLARFREVIGAEVPLGVSLDLHANITAEMCANSDILNTYRTNPHIDAKEVAEEIADIVIRTARDEIRPTQAFQPVPAVINILCQNTGTSPMREVMTDTRRVMGEPGVLSASVAEGFPYADVPEMGMSVVVVTHDDSGAAAAHALALGEKVWARRAQFDRSAMSPAAALRIAAKPHEAPVLLLDVGDNVGGGAPGDSVALLLEARRLGLGSLLTIVVDPTSAAASDRVGVGARVRLSIGARTYPETGPPVEATATVLAIHDGVYAAREEVHAGLNQFDAGLSAAVVLDTGQTVLLTSRPTLPLTTAQLAAVGLEPAMFRAIVAKGVHSPLAGYGPHICESVLVDTPGVTSANLGGFRYQRRRRPLYPFERQASYPPQDRPVEPRT